MVTFPNAKINIGLNIVNRRTDGYHDIVTLFYPVGWCDVLEIVPGKSDTITLTTTGRAVDCPSEKNLVMKAVAAMDSAGLKLPPLDIYLHKVIPDGAGLGGGSSDAAFTVKTINQLLQLGLSDKEMASIVAPIGADCPFFIYNRPMLATGTGTTLTPFDLSLANRGIAIVKPAIHVPTREAYADVTPRQPVADLSALLKTPIEHWRGEIVNDFEPSIFANHREIADIKQRLIERGANYSAMSGSGSAVFAIFENDKLAERAVADIEGCDIFTGRLD